jgi:hypothetical protein
VKADRAVWWRESCSSSSSSSSSGSGSGSGSSAVCFSSEDSNARYSATVGLNS